MVSAFSLAAAVIVFNLSMIAVAILRKQTAFLLKHSTSVLLLLALLAALRTLTPLDFPFTYVIRSYKIIPAGMSFLKLKPLPEPIQVSTGFLLLCVWLLGAAIVILRACVRSCAATRRRKQYKTVENAQVLQALKKLGAENTAVTVSPDVDIPFVTGLLKAHIFLPTLDLTDEELELILKHELQHFRSRDAFIKTFYFLLSAVFWWNPVVHTFQNELDRILELRCDFALVKKMSEREKIAYLEAMLLVVKQMDSPNTRVPVFTSALVKADSKNFLVQRFNLILQSDPRKNRTRQTVSMGLVCLLFIMSFLVVIQPAGFPPAEETIGTAAITPDNAYIVIDGEKLELYVEGHFYYEITEDQLTDALANLPVIKKEENER